MRSRATHTGIRARVVEMPINTLRYLTLASLASILVTVDPALGQEVDYIPRPSQPLFSMILGGRNLYQLS